MSSLNFGDKTFIKKHDNVQQLKLKYEFNLRHEEENWQNERYLSEQNSAQSEDKHWITQDTKHITPVFRLTWTQRR